MNATNCQHTPGPWEHREATENGTSFVLRRWRITAGDQFIGEVGAAVHRCGSHNENHGDANARLVAAAPDLLAACRKLLNVLESEPECAIYRAHAELARAAIAKATGGAP